MQKNLVDEKLGKVDSLKKVAEELGCSLPQLCIAWCVKNPHVSTVITGSTKPEQVQASLRATSLHRGPVVLGPVVLLWMASGAAVQLRVPGQLRMGPCCCQALPAELRRLLCGSRSRTTWAP